MAVYTIALILVVIFCLAKRSSYSNSDFVGAMILSLVLFYILFNNINNTLLKITVAPGGLELRYLLTKKQIVINYADITHVSNTHAKQEVSYPTSNDGAKLTVELSTGETLILVKETYSNYNELKEAIRRNRFHLDELS